MKVEPASSYKRLVGTRLRRAREAAGFRTARELATLLEVEENTLTTWERGDRFPAEQYLPLILEITGISLDYIYAGRLDNVPHRLAVKLRDQEAASRVA